MTNRKKYQISYQKSCVKSKTTLLKSLFITTLLLFISGFVFAQSSKNIKLDFKNVPITQVIASIEKQSNYTFFYNSDVDKLQKVSIKISTSDIYKIMRSLLGTTSISYNLSGQRIILYIKKKETDKKGKAYTVSGIVNDASGPIIGATIVTKNNKGTISGIDGSFKLSDIYINDVLSISFIGYATQNVIYNGQSKLSIILDLETTLLDQVVVTALGIKRAEKALTYNVQQVDGDELTTVKSANFLNSLIGKAAGVTINSSASGPGGAVKVVMRGAKSISQNNNALYVIDGIPMYNRTTGGGDGSMTSQPGSEAIADINPDDIESMSLLTGPSAAALYGYEGANGVVLITTKKGNADKTTITFSNNTTFSNPMMMPKFQNTYGNMAGETMSWGEFQDKYRHDPSDFFNTGSNVSNSLSLATGNDKSQSYLSVATNNATGILPNNKYNRYNFSFRNTTNFLNKKFILDTNANYIIQDDKNMVSQGQYFNPLPAIYLFPRAESFQDMTVFEQYDEISGVNKQNWPYGAQGLSMQNPYWIMNRMNRENEKRRYKLAVSLQYNMTSWLNLQGRVSIDNTENKHTDKRYAGTDGNFAGTKGRYEEGNWLDRQLYADALANFNKTFGDFSITANLGASIKDIRTESSSLIGDLNHVTNHFSIENLTRKGYYKVSANGLKRQTQSLFANAEVGWRNFLYLNLTARNDWDSALAFSQSGDDSFLYPSIGISSIISEVVKLPEWFSFLKVRFSFTSVGNSYDPYLTQLRYIYDDQTDEYKTPSLYPNYYLKPEITNSYEAGLNMRFFKGKLNFDFTYYRSDTRNQTFEAKLSYGAGYDAVNVQAGSVQNEGIEMALGYENEWAGFNWSSNVTFSHNKNKIKQLADGVTNWVTGEMIEMPHIDKAKLGETGAPTVRLMPNGSMGDLYIHRDFKRDNNGFIYLNKGVPSMVETEYKKIGSLLPKFHMGWRNSFSYKGVRLNVLLSGRFGGLVVSNTQAYLDRFGVSEFSAALRQAGGVTINGTNISAKDYLNVITAGGGEGDHYVYEATNIRLQEVSLEYSIPKKWLHNIADVTVGVIGNNLGMIYCKAPFDPELVASANSTFYTGVDYFMQPSMRNIGFSLKVQF